MSPLLPPLGNSQSSETSSGSGGGNSELAGESITNFKRDLLTYLEAYQLARLRAWIELIRSHDFSSIRCVTASVPFSFSFRKKPDFKERKGSKMGQHIEGYPSHFASITYANIWKMKVWTLVNIGLPTRWSNYHKNGIPKNFSREVADFSLNAKRLRFARTVYIFTRILKNFRLQCNYTSRNFCMVNYYLVSFYCSEIVRNFFFKNPCSRTEQLDSENSRALFERGMYEWRWVHLFIFMSFSKWKDFILFKELVGFQYAIHPTLCFFNHIFVLKSLSII